MRVKNTELGGEWINFRLTPFAAALLVSLFVVQGEAVARTISTDNPDVKMRWDNTLKYSAGWRVSDPDAYVANGDGLQPNTDYGDLAHDKGLINNRFDLLSEFDLRYKKVGFRVSGAAWYDNVYQDRENDYTGPVPNSVAALGGAANNQYSDEAMEVMGKNAEILDAFAFTNVPLGDDSRITVRAGQHTQLYGETLFLGANGIANAQGPIDLIKAYSLPNAQFKEIAIPVGQVSTDIIISPGISAGAYYQYEWAPHRLPAPGSYFSAADFVGPGADLLLTPFGPATRSSDREGSDSGNFGIRLKFSTLNTEYGLYAARYDDKGPVPVFDVPSSTYSLMYAKNIDTYGASFSTVLGETNVAGEMSVRRNTPLAPVGDLIISTVDNANNDDNTPYARGNSFHLNLSAITLLPATRIWDGASVVGEFAFNRLTSVSHNPGSIYVPSALNDTHTRDSSVFRVNFVPEFFQVFPGVDIKIPVGVGYGLDGRSAIFQASPEHGGDVSVGFNADVNRIWNAGLNVTHYFGDEGPAPSLEAGRDSYASYKQYYADRDFISLYVQRTF